MTDRPQSTNERSIVLVDWARHNEPTASSRKSLLYELMLLSLLYDQILVPDEIFVSGHKMTQWFNQPNTFRLLQEVFDACGIIVLKRPLHRYPTALQEVARKNPIRARREHLQEYAVTNDGKPIKFSDGQIEFHKKLEALLRQSPSTHRDAGSKKGHGADIMNTFGRLLTTTLTDARYQKWREARFRAVTQEMADDFAEFIQDPDKAIVRVRKMGQEPKYTPRDGQPVFNTALAVQVAGAYPRQQAEAMQGLIETVFAIPFCEDEDAGGRYGRALRELPLAFDRWEPGPLHVKVETKVRIPAGLPMPEAGFSKVIAHVRENSGKQLRAAMARLGDEPSFSKLEQAWRVVADEIATHVGTKKRSQKVDVWGLACSLGKNLVFESIADLLVRRPANVAEASLCLPMKLLGEGLSLGGGYVYRLLREDLQRQQISEKLEGALAFRCVSIPRLDTVRT